MVKIFVYKILHQKKKKYKLETPKPFHIECDPRMILSDVIYLFNEMVTKANNKTGIKRINTSGGKRKSIFYPLG